MASDSIKQKIKKEARQTAETFGYQKNSEVTDDLADCYYAGAMVYVDKYIDADLKQDKFASLLDEARLQIEYLHKKFGETGTGNNMLSRIETALHGKTLKPKKL
jgi:hypothetical protein